MRTMLMAAVAVGLLAPVAQAQGKAKSAPAAAQSSGSSPVQLQTEDEKAIYSLGYSFGKNVAPLSLSASEVEILKKGITDAANGTPAAVNVDQYGPRVQLIARNRQAQANEQFLARAAAEKGAEKLPSGIVYKEIKAGTGASPKPTDTVAVNYRGMLTSGEEFDSSYKRGQVAEFPLNGVIPCWTQGLQKMKVGGRAQLVCPAKLAYGDRPPPGSKIPPNAVLEFEVELVNIPGDTSKH